MTRRSDRTPPTLQQVVVALPLALALLAATLLVWSRDDPARSGGFCTNMTLQVAGLLRGSEGGGNEVRDPEDILQATLSRLDLFDPARVEAGSPAELRAPIRELNRLVPAYAAAVGSAAADGMDRPDPPAELRGAFVTVLARYYQDCI